MPDGDTLFAGSIPDVYDRYFGPVIFESYAGDLAGHAAAHQPGRVLETAAGTGILTRAMLRRLPESASVIATDLSQPMLDYAARNTKASRVAWRQADATKLPFEDESFDAVVCQFGVMFFPDKTAAYREAYRVLKPGGRFLFNVWGPLEQNDFASVITETMCALFPVDPPTFFARVPHGYYNSTLIRGELEAGGFSNVEITTVELMGRAASSRHAAIGFCQGSPLRNEIEARDPSRLTEATDVAAAALARSFGAGAIEGRLQALLVSATK